MTARFFSGRPDARLWGYIILGGTVLAPVLIFAIGPLSGRELTDSEILGPAGVALAFSAGVLSFASPCMLPMVPVYLSHLSGASVVNGRLVNDRRVTLTHALAFVAGLSLVFIGLGSSVGLLGSYIVLDHQQEFEQLAGILLMIMGAVLIPPYGRGSPLRSALILLGLALIFVVVGELANLRGDRLRLIGLAVAFLFGWLRFSGYVRLNFLQRTFEIDTSRFSSVGYSRSAIIGGAWAVGWTPCIGPVLAAILTLAATSGHALAGLYLLTAYSAGFSIPLLASALLLSDANRLLRRITPFASAIEVGSGVMLIAVGVFILSGSLTNLNSYFEIPGLGQGL